MLLPYIDIYSSLTCFGLNEKCNDDKCCRKALNDMFYYCKHIIEWRNDTRAVTTVPVCSDRCANALNILYSDPIGRNMRCCTCGKFSDIDQSDLTALRKLEMCKQSRLNLENICKLTQSFSHCNPLDTFQGIYIAMYIATSKKYGYLHLASYV